MKRRWLKFRNCYKIIQRGIVLWKFASWTCKDIFWEQPTKTQQSVVGTRSTEADVQQVVVSNTVQSYNFTEGETRYWKYVSPIDPVNTASGNPVGIISVTSNFESRYTQVKDIGVIFISSSIFVIILAIVITVMISQGITRPIAEMKQQNGTDC